MHSSKRVRSGAHLGERMHTHSCYNVYILSCRTHATRPLARAGISAIADGGAGDGGGDLQRLARASRRRPHTRVSKTRTKSPHCALQRSAATPHAAGRALGGPRGRVGRCAR